MIFAEYIRLIDYVILRYVTMFFGSGLMLDKAAITNVTKAKIVLMTYKAIFGTKSKSF